MVNGTRTLIRHLEWISSIESMFLWEVFQFFGPDLGPVEDRWGADCMEGGLDWKQLSSWS